MKNYCGGDSVYSFLFIQCLYNPIKNYVCFKYYKELKNLIPEELNSGMRLI